MRRVVALILALSLAGVAAADTAVPPGLRDVGFDQRPGAALDPTLEFRDETARPVHLGDYFGARPLLVVPVYYRCPMLCSLVTGGLVSALRAVAFDAGREFDVVVVSFDPREGPEQAAAKKTAVLAEYRREGAAAGWHFLTGSDASITGLMQTLGFRYRWDAADAQYAHAAGIVVVTPGGRIARYFFGVEFAPRDLRLALVDASAGRIGSVVDQLLLFCFHWDPATGRYSGAALAAVRIGGVATLVALGAFVWITLHRERRRAPASAEGA